MTTPARPPRVVPTASLVCTLLVCTATASAQHAETPQAAKPPTLDTALARYAGEPAVEQVVAAALDALGDEPARMRALATRARYSGLLPRVSLQARRGQAVDLSAVTGSSDSLRTSTDDDLMLQATLSFDLPKLLFARSEVSIARQRQAAVEARRAFVREVVALYFERRRLQLQRDMGATVTPDLHARLSELRALLDVFTRGAFGRMLDDRNADGQP